MTKSSDSVPRQPWMKFYGADWRANIELRACSLAARGLWMEMLCLMHEATPKGSLLLNGRQVSTAQLAVLAGAPARETQTLLTELEEAAVFSRDDDGAIYSRRMRRDIERAARDKTNGKGGGNPNLLKGKTGGLTPSPTRNNNRQVIREDGNWVEAPDKAHMPEARVYPSQRSTGPDHLRLRDVTQGGTYSDPVGVHETTNGSALAWDDNAPFGTETLS